MNSQSQFDSAGLTARLRIAVRGAVQGVGFRPFVYRLATELRLAGWVNNSTQGVFIEAEGPPAQLENLLLRLETEKPPRSFIQSLEASWLDPAGYTGFVIRPSETGGARTALVLPDIAVCPDCLREVFDSANRRYFYPFTNCTNCGPRFSIIESLPYDRPNTAMKGFAMCPQCQAEYDDPRDRRFHAQPNACLECGPQIQLWDRQGKVVSSRTSPRPRPRGGRDRSPKGPSPARSGRLGEASLPAAGNADGGSRAVLAGAVEAIREGKILAVKGLGGFHLVVAADNDQAVRRLRKLKHREEKPLALMFPSLEGIRAVCEVSPPEERLLRSPEAPIVLLARLHAPRTTHHASHLSPAIAPGNPNLGVMLPYTPLHHLLLSLLGAPVVATSGNRSDEPICTDEHEALERLGGIADLFLVHNRPIVRHVDDSIARVMIGREQVLRRARGYAPLPIQLRFSTEDRPSPIGSSVLAVGAHLKNTVALSVGPQVFLSQHIGDLETDLAYEAFRRVIADFQRLYEASPALVAADAHPDYLSTKFARDLVSGSSRRKEALISGPQLITVQHHIAHVLSCMAENELQPPLLGVSWDGTGYGLDHTIWGGEFFLVTDAGCQRLAHLRQFRLPGGDQAVKEPRRTALGLLHEMLGDAAFDMTAVAPLRAFSPGNLKPLKTMLARRLNSPLTSSVGRLFDAVAALIGLRQQVRFEGQAAMELEFALRDVRTDDAYELPLRPHNDPRPAAHAPDIVDWSAMIESILTDLERRVALGVISARFHNALAQAIVAVARASGQERVVLSGGCFQNRYLTERAVRRLREGGFLPYWHQRVPPNDGGIALGQTVAALSAQGSIETAGRIRE